LKKSNINIDETHCNGSQPELKPSVVLFSLSKFFSSRFRQITRPRLYNGNSIIKQMISKK